MTDTAFWSGKRVFVTGHTGFKGTWLTRALLLAGADITGYALPPPQGFPSLFEMTGTAKHIRSITADIRDAAGLEQAVREARPDIVLHLAAQPLVRLSYKEPVDTYETNVMGTVHIMEAVRRTETVRAVLNVTTDKVYENKEWYWGYRENENLCGYDPYSNSKSCSELVTYSYRNSFFGTDTSPAVSTARSGNVIGGGDFAEDRIIPDCMRAACRQDNIVIRNPHSVRPYQHVLECLSGYLLLSKKQYEDKTLAGAYNFGPDEKSCITTGELTELFCSLWGGISWSSRSDSGPHEACFLKLDCSKSKTVLDWQPRWTIQAAVGKTVEWHKAVLDGTDAADITDCQISEYFHRER